ncbi:MAG: hypothetical protein FJ280_21110 [Planctomycetes bacterium]|nr:hypothetical protein [Planctomycetota bacterium]
MVEQEGVKKNQGPALGIPGPGGPWAKLVPWLVPALVVIVLALGGFFIGRLFGTRGQSQTVRGAEPARPVEAAPRKDPPLKPSAGDNWYYELDPVVVNLNEPGVTRYVRISLTLEINSALSDKEGRPFLDQRKPLMKHWLTLFLSNQTLEDARGERNLMRMQTQISDTLNQGLFPDGPPRVQRVLFKEFAIQ